MQNGAILDFAKAEVLAHYQELAIVDQPWPNAAEQAKLAAPKKGGPALVRVARGKGHYVVCGPSLGFALGMSGGCSEAVPLALIRLSTRRGGRSRCRWPAWRRRRSRARWVSSW
ncbi:MAG: hypothetical protein GW802_14540 [Armatimonadetes bacterium]|nr:hypothetical protein [Armatimonadota bacterium]NCP33863.1 hypothetical protein [Armatimonadota bacterium]NCQ28630.1 hypothetical protein [Armatimonadota bacterium]